MNIQSSDAVQATAMSPPASGEFLAFKLGREEYGIDILKVQEIRGYEAPTRMANAPASILGVVNLRGVIVPIIDMRIKFGLGTPRYDQITVTIVLNIGSQVVGMVVDSVSDVIRLGNEQIRPAPQFNASMSTEHIIGIGTLKDSENQRMLILLDIDKLMCDAELGLIARNTQ